MIEIEAAWMLALHQAPSCSAAIQFRHFPHSEQNFVPFRRQAQVRPRPGGVHLRSSQPLPGHHQPVSLHPQDHRINEKLKALTSQRRSKRKLLEAKYEFVSLQSVGHSDSLSYLIVYLALFCFPFDGDPESRG